LTVVVSSMLTQIYEVSSAREAAAICQIGVDHVGVLVGDGSFPREQSVSSAAAIALLITEPSKFSALFLSADRSFIVGAVRTLEPHIVHLGAAPELVTPQHVLELKRAVPGILVMRSMPVVGVESIEIARLYDGVADFILLDSYRADDRQIGALGITHDWSVSAQIVATVHTPVILAGGLGPDNVTEAIRVVRPAGVDSKTRTDIGDTHMKDLEKVRLFHDAARAARK
jgi:phosphoribosylanthranilate isomerase